MKTKQDSPVPFAFIPVEQLASNTYNARRFDDMTPQRQARFDELVASIREKGVIEPLLVRPLGDDRYEVIAGERRFRGALVVASESDIRVKVPNRGLPCMIRDVGEDEAFDLMLIENMQREDLTPFETAQAFSDYLKRHGDTPEAASDIALRIGIPVYAIRRQVRLLRLPAEVVTAWKSGTITQSHAELFTRVGDSTQALEFLALCIRLKLTTRELAERIGAVSPDLDKGFFDKTECQTCHFNTAVQSGLFADADPAGRCGNAPCFEAKQGAFLSANWPQSKAAEKYGTCGFRFSHRLEQDHRQPSPSQEANARCRNCDTFVSVVRLTGAVVGGYERTCVGPRACFDELYCALPTPAPREEKPEPPPPPAPAGDPTAAPKSEPAKPAAKQTPPPAQTKEETGPVFNAPRGEKFRELFYRKAIPSAIEDSWTDTPRNQRLVLLALALSAPAARKYLETAHGFDTHLTTDLSARIFEIPGDDLFHELRSAAIAVIMDSTTVPAVRQFISEAFGVDLARDWALTKEYLESLTVSELVRVGEEDGVGIWDDEKVRIYRKEKFKGKALRSLKKQELADIVLSSGADLNGRVPAEVLGKKG